MIVSRKHERLPIKTRVVKRADEISPDAWKNAFPPIIESRSFFNVLDDSRLGQFSFYYVLAYERNRVVGIAPCFFLEYSLDTSINGPLRIASNAVKRVFPKIFSLRAFACGSPINQGRIGFAENCDKEKVMRAIERRVEQTAKKLKASAIGFKDFGNSYLSILDPLQKRGYARFDSLPNTELDVRYRDFEEYLMTLSGASRYDLRRKFRKVDGDKRLRMEMTSSPDEKTMEELYKLYRRTEEAHEMGFEVLTPDFFFNLMKHLPEETKFFIWRLDEKIAGFVVCLVSGERLIDYYVGLDYSVAYDLHLFFLKFREILKWCIENGIKTYEMGISGYEPKRRLGFGLVPLYLYVKHRNPFMRPVFQAFCKLLRFENFDPSLKKMRRDEKQPPPEG